MKNLFITTVLLLPILVISQTQTENYIKTSTYQFPSLVENVLEDQKIESITYYDGLGRPKQTISERVGGNKEDLITPIFYDPLGRQPKDYLPLPIQDNGDSYYEPETGSIQIELREFYRTKFPNDFYQPPGYIPEWDRPYSEKIFEGSPLSRVLEQGSPGIDWKVETNSDSDHTIKLDYKTNSANEVIQFKVTLNGNTPSLVSTGFYPARHLNKNITKDENWQPSDDFYGINYYFTNKLGQLVLNRTSVYDINKGPQDPNYHDTYYVYDDFGNLTYVLSPEGTEKVVGPNGSLIANPQPVLDGLCYQYKYDYRNRVVEKKIPGKGWEYIVYDVLNRPVLTQDAVLRLDDQWLFTKYDDLGRVAYTGIYTNTTESFAQIEANLRIPTYVSEKRKTPSITIGDTQIYYTNFAYPTTNLQILTVNYYDDYIDTVTDMGTINLPNSVFNVPVSNQTNGLPTVSKVRILTTSDFITSVTGYDNKGRAIYSRSINEYLDTNDVGMSLLDFTGKPLETNTIHSKTGYDAITTKDYFNYDHMGRLKSHKQKIDNEPVQLIAKNTFDDIGKLVSKGVGGTAIVSGYTDLQHVDISPSGVITSIPGGSGSWAYKAKTKGEIPGTYDGGIDFITQQVGKDIRVGLIESNHGSLSNDYFDYGIFLDHNPTGNTNTVRLIIRGTIYSGYSSTYTAPLLFRVAREGQTVVFYKGSTPIHTENISIPENEKALVGKVAFDGTPGASISNLNLFGALLDKPLQSIGYKYNVRGWLTDINDIEYGSQSGEFKLEEYSDLFNFRINYNRIDGTIAGEALYNGNISQTLWKTDNTDKNIRAYNYSYDNLNRIKSATSFLGSSLSSLQQSNSYNLSGVNYDFNGNITSLIRKGKDDEITPSYIWDQLGYTYTYNQLQKVDDSGSQVAGFKDGINTGNDYTYDVNGNLKADANKNIILINYNHLNLPTQINFQIEDNTPTIEYVYDATGVKLEKRLIDEGSHSTYYAGNYIYEGIALATAELQFFSHPEGYIKPTPLVPESGEETESVQGFDDDTGQITYSEYKYVFQFKDHLGNVRLSYLDNDLNGAIDGSEIIEESNYYPFGLKQLGYNDVITGNGNDLAQQWKYQGQERQDELGLNWDSFKWRNYMPDLGRFFNIDPLATKYTYNSPYAFQENKLGMGKELEGLELVDLENLNESGEIIGGTINVFDSSERKSTGKPIFTFGIGIDREITSTSIGAPGAAGGDCEVSACELNLELQVGSMDGTRIEANASLGNVETNLDFLGNNVNSEFSLINSSASYNLDTNSTDSNINVLEGKTEVNKDTEISINGGGAYVKTNVDEGGRALYDIGVAIKSLFTAAKNSYFGNIDTSLFIGGKTDEDKPKP